MTFISVRNIVTFTVIGVDYQIWMLTMLRLTSGGPPLDDADRYTRDAPWAAR